MDTIDMFDLHYVENNYSNRDIYTIYITFTQLSRQRGSFSFYIMHGINIYTLRRSANFLGSLNLSFNLFSVCMKFTFYSWQYTTAQTRKLNQFDVYRLSRILMAVWSSWKASTSLILFCYKPRFNTELTIWQYPIYINWRHLSFSRYCTYSWF